MGTTFADTASSGPLILAVGVAMLAGLVSFASPCILPLVPGYVSYVTGLSGDDLRNPGRRGRVLTGSFLFIAGFTAVLATIFFAASSVSNTLFTNQVWFERVVGALIIVMGLVFLGVVPGTDRLLRVRRLPDAGLTSAPVFGAVFALSWTPCLGPTLTAILGLSVVSGGTGRGLTLIIAYCLGLGLPFLLFGLAFRKLIGFFDFFKRHARAVTAAGGVMLMVVGVALVSGVWMEFVNWLRAEVGPGEIGI